MSLETNLVALLSAACGRVFTDFAPFDTARPYITYQQIGGEARAFLDGSLPSKENAEMQINVWANTRAEAKGLIKQIEASLASATSLQARALGASVSDSEPELRIYGSRQDFSIWADR